MFAVVVVAATLISRPPLAVLTRAPTLVADSPRRSAVVQMNSGEEESRRAAVEAPEESADLLASFVSSVEAEGGSTSMQERQLKAIGKDAGKAVSSAGTAINKALDLDGQQAAQNYPGRSKDLLEVGGWRATVLFGFVTILFAFNSLFTTDFGDGGAPQQLCTGDERLCTRKEIENSRIAEISSRNREAASERY